MSDRCRIGFVGVGLMGQCAHLANYARLPECEVVAIAEPRAGLREAVAARYGIPRTYSSAEEMLEAERLDALVAAQPFDRHGTIVRPLFRYGLPIFTEKPLARSVRAGESMLEALKAGGSWHMVGYHKRYDAATEAAKREIDRLKESGELGGMRYVRVTMPPGDWIASGDADFISSDEQCPVTEPDPADDGSPEPQFTAFVNYYIHQVNLLRHLLGEPYAPVFADAAGRLLVAESRSGITGAIEMAPYQTSADWQESALVGFDQGAIHLDLPAPLARNRTGRLRIYRDGGDRAPTWVEPNLGWEHAMLRQAKGFVSAVRGDCRPACEAAEALEDLRVARRYFEILGQ